MADEHQFKIAGLPLYPHVKLTREAFPRALATRIVKDDGDEYFGAFLNRTAVRILIDFLNRTFKLRSCTIAIDGTFPVPCTQFYAKRCVAPCVESLCDQESYLEMVALARLFLRNDREVFVAAITRKIDQAALGLDFESAAVFRDILKKVEHFWAQARWRVWLDDTVDTFEVDVETGVVYVILISQRRQRSLGERIFAFSSPAGVDPTLALHDVIDQFYTHHLPREIRVTHDFDGRLALAKNLETRFGRKINITLANQTNRRVTTERAIDLTKARAAIERIRTKPMAREIQDELKSTFGLARGPVRVEAFDVAHISATGFAAAASVWKNGVELPEEYAHALMDSTSELEALDAFAADRVSRTKPELVVVDGGSAQVKAAMNALTKAAHRPVIIGAVKPRGKHSSVSHFLTDDERRIEFDVNSEAHRLLKRLRDDAHDLANATHRLGRDMMHFYELSAILPSLNERERLELMRELGSIRTIVGQEANYFIERFGKKRGKSASDDIEAWRSGRSSKPRPLIVPVRFVEADGAAEDLIPIEVR